MSNEEEAVTQAQGVLQAHFSALNVADEKALAATLHFPHYRLSSGKMKVWESPESYLSDFHARAGDGWHHSDLDSIDVFAAEPEKVHLDVRFTRYREDNSSMGQFRSLWVIAKLNNVWAAQLRSSFAP
ncbi:MAG: hypothetical protein GKS01_19150 [Alphaproteobacteria bacterium]|nr:hypothetical protein [Alphaproteobacteria bacterium]